MHTTLPFPFRARAKALAAVAAVGLALFAAGTAGAQPNQTPVDKNGKKSCSIENPVTGTKVWVPHGTTITKEFKDGTKQTEQCLDGDWWIMWKAAPGFGSVFGTHWTYAGTVVTTVQFGNAHNASTMATRAALSR